MAILTASLCSQVCRHLPAAFAILAKKFKVQRFFVGSSHAPPAGVTALHRLTAGEHRTGARTALGQVPHPRHGHEGGVLRTCTCSPSRKPPSAAPGAAPGAAAGLGHIYLTGRIPGRQPASGMILASSSSRPISARPASSRASYRTAPPARRRRAARCAPHPKASPISWARVRT